MLSNNGYVRGQYGVFGDKVYSGIKLNEYNLFNDEYTKHFLTTKEYVDSKFSKNTAFSVKSGYVHSMSGENNITQYSVGTTAEPKFDEDGKKITNNENFEVNDGYIIKSGDIYSIGYINSVETGTGTGHINDIIQLELGQQLYSELDNQIYTLIEAPIGGNNSTIIPILVPETITTTITNSNNNDVITFDKLYNDTVYHKLTINPLSFSLLEQTIEFTIPSNATTLYDKYIEFCLNNYAENDTSKIISLSAFSGIHNDGQNEFTTLLFETSTNKYTAMFEHTEGTSTIINTINLTYTAGTQGTPGTYANASSVINGYGNYTYYLIDYYNNNVVKVVLKNGTSPTIHPTMETPITETINITNGYFKDLSLLAEIKITKDLTASPNKTYTVLIRALSSPENQRVSDWTVESSIILNTYKS